VAAFFKVQGRHAEVSHLLAAGSVTVCVFFTSLRAREEQKLRQLFHRLHKIQSSMETESVIMTIKWK
jgi:hypothetical protein